ncbi:MAG: tRNA (adenosine(37)-N6)-threonylcarbamoyltransferase complex transferase subunit TsaD [Clostridiales Family XIII bacterium]|jgi:N6-L-threonylcarbamoyladenine synthase|nr:tRNA (adenosine(37)-N6)-threonylcarbamoyltransferase complex transferase subunit TsaD [Clostridiales Family XIII bacterium]
MKDKRFITLAIETSCDETAVAVLSDGRDVRSNVIASQIAMHRVFGGVVPEIASRRHLEQVNEAAEQALAEAGLCFEDIDLIGVTQGPGLVGALLIGLATAKAYAFALKKPIVGVHHVQAHICAGYIEHKELAPPFLALVVSGGHTNLVKVAGYNDYRVLGRTRDDAVGEAFDKVARTLGLEYPGGPAIDRVARDGDPSAVPFKRVFLEKNSLDFSFSGVKTGVLNYLNTERQAGRAVSTADVAAGFQQSVVDVIVAKSLLAAEMFRENKLVMAGGVAANSLLRKTLREACGRRGIALYCPSPVLCTDNGAMVGVSAYYKYQTSGADALDLDAFPSLPLG